MEISEDVQRVYDIFARTPAVTFVWRNTESWPVEFVGKNVENLLGYSVGDFESGRVPYGSLIHPEDIERVFKEVSEASLDSTLSSFRHKPYRLIAKSKRVLYVDDMTYIRRDPSGSVTHYEGVIVDITDQVSIQKEYEEHREKLYLNSKLASIGIFAAGMAHEINNPLMIVKGAAELIKMKLANFHQEDIGELVKLVDKQTRGVTRISNIVGGLKTYSHSASNDENRIELNSLIRSVASFVEILFIEKELSLKTIVAEAPIFVKVNAGKLEQALVNLLSNARDAVEEKLGEITISVEKLSYREVSIAVLDNGHGISKEEQAHIFDMFFTTKPPGRGTGLGLGITKKIIEGFGGTVEFSSKLNFGTKFKILLPISEQELSTSDLS